MKQPEHNKVYLVELMPEYGSLKLLCRYDARDKRYYLVLDVPESAVLDFEACPEKPAK